jgi:hypothetical protein
MDFKELPLFGHFTTKDTKRLHEDTKKILVVACPLKGGCDLLRDLCGELLETAIERYFSERIYPKKS